MSHFVDLSPPSAITGYDDLVRGNYVPFFNLAEGDYGYEVDVDADSIVTQDADGLLVSFVAGSSFEATLTGLSPTDGEFFLVWASALFMTIGAPSSPTAGDRFWFRDRLNSPLDYWINLVLEYDGSAWQLFAERVLNGATVPGSKIDLTAAGKFLGDHVAGLRSQPGDNQGYRTVHATWHTPGDVLVCRESGMSPNAIDYINDQTKGHKVRFGGSIAAGTWDVRLHGFVGQEDPALAEGAPFPLF